MPRREETEEDQVILEEVKVKPKSKSTSKKPFAKDKTLKAETLTRSSNQDSRKSTLHSYNSKKIFFRVPAHQTMTLSPDQNPYSEGVVSEA